MLPRSLNRLALPALALLALLAPGTQAQTPLTRTPSPAELSQQADIAHAYAKLPLAFEANHGQTDPRVRFLAHTPQGTLFLTGTEAVLTLPQHPNRQGKRTSSKTRSHESPTPNQRVVLRMKLTGAHNPLTAVGLEKLPGIVNYFRGNDPRKWHTHIPTYGKTRFAGVYKGVDMIYYGTQNGRLEYDFVVKPGADPKAIKLAFSGASKARLTKDGDLALQTAAGEVRWQRPVTYQMLGGHREVVACAYEFRRQGNQEHVGFRLAHYDASRPVVIDPTLTYSTFLGGDDSGAGIAVDSSGSAYVTGGTGSSDFPVTVGTFQTELSNEKVNAFVTKLDATGSSLVYSTYLGGSGFIYGGDGGTSIVVDSAGNAYVTGYTTSSNFPTTPGAFQTTNKGFIYWNSNVFVTKLDATGSSLVYSTYLGGTGGGYGGDEGYSIAVDSSGNAYVTGETPSSNFPITQGAFQTTNNGPVNAFVTKLNATGSSLIYSTYLGGSVSDRGGNGDKGFGIALDSSGNAYVTGLALSANFPTTRGAFQTKNNAFANFGPNAFVTKLNATGSSMVYSTYLGGSEGDGAQAIAVDSTGDAYVAGYSGSPNFPITQGAFQTTFNGFSYGSCGFVTKLNATGTSLIYSTYLGGSGTQSGNGGNSCAGIAVDSAGNAYVAGYSGSPNFPITRGAFQTTNNGAANLASNAFVTKLNATGSSLVYSTYLGGSGTQSGSGDSGQGIALDSIGNAYVTGYTSSSNFPTTVGAFQTTSDGYTAFVTKFTFTLPAITNLTVTNLTSSSATISWNTNLDASTLVNYGPTTAYGSTATGAANVTTHSVTLTGLSPNTLYYFQASSTASGETATQTGSFLTSPQTAPQIVVSNYKCTRSGSDLFVDITLTNTGTATAQNIQITKATLGTKTSSGLPVAFPAITAGGTYTLVHALHFNSADFPSGTRTVLSGSGTYTGGSYSAATRVTVP